MSVPLISTRSLAPGQAPHGTALAELHRRRSNAGRHPVSQIGTPILVMITKLDGGNHR